MLVAIHQPHFIPWLGYLHRMAQADLFIVLDHVQFERGNYQNRTQVRVNGVPHWLTVPVVQRSQKERIVEKEIDWSRDWATVHYETLRRAYSAAGYELRASFALFGYSIEYFAQHGIEWLDLGAGAGIGTDAKSGLNRFKQGWSTDTRTAYFCGRIFDQERYQEIIKAMNVGPTNYFPAYRAGEFS